MSADCTLTCHLGCAIDLKDIQCIKVQAEDESGYERLVSVSWIFLSCTYSITKSYTWNRDKVGFGGHDNQGISGHCTSSHALKKIVETLCKIDWFPPKPFYLSWYQIAQLGACGWEEQSLGTYISFTGQIGI